MADFSVIFNNARLFINKNITHDPCLKIIQGLELKQMIT
jgi:hypothetical protein